jgi:hypothetical protein
VEKKSLECEGKAVKNFSILPTYKRSGKEAVTKMSEVKLNSLVIRDNDISLGSAIEDIAGSLNHCKLTVLDLANNSIGNIGLKNICKSLNGHCVLRTLDLTNNKVTFAGA